MQCEITSMDIKISNTESLRLLVFKFSKNDKGEKKKDYETDDDDEEEEGQGLEEKQQEMLH